MWGNLNNWGVKWQTFYNPNMESQNILGRKRPRRIIESNSWVNGPYGDQTHNLGTVSTMLWPAELFLSFPQTVSLGQVKSKLCLTGLHSHTWSNPTIPTVSKRCWGSAVCRMLLMSYGLIIAHECSLSLPKFWMKHWSYDPGELTCQQGVIMLMVKVV